MADADWEPSRQFADGLRFSGDHRHPDWAGEAPDGIGQWRALISRHEVRVTADITPSIFASMNLAASRLSVPDDAIDAFVYESPEVQATCVSDGDSRCLIRISSGLARLLSADEMQFVFGHEIAHHLLRHARHDGFDMDSIDGLRIRRAGEVSADRLGLVACGSLDVAIRAMLKVISGLSDDLIRFDVRPFLAQLDSTGEAAAGIAESHPSMAVRCRAVMWFASEYDAASRSVPEHRRQVVDDRVARDLDRYSNATALRVVAMAEDELALWLAIDAILDDGRVSKAEQAWLKSEFGDETADGAMRMIQSQARDVVRDLVREKTRAAHTALKALVPNTYAVHEQNCHRRVAGKPE